MDVAIIGLAFRLPEGIDDVSGLWDVLEKRKNLMKEWPGSRTRLDSFYQQGKVNKVFSSSDLESTQYWVCETISYEPIAS